MRVSHGTCLERRKAERWHCTGIFMHLDSRITSIRRARPKEMVRRDMFLKASPAIFIHNPGMELYRSTDGILMADLEGNDGSESGAGSSATQMAQVIVTEDVH